MRLLSLFPVLMLSAVSAAQLRVATWNITYYAGGRTTAFQTAIYGTFENRQFAPDVLVVQEVLSSAATTEFRNLLNSASGSPGDWAAAPFTDGPDSDSAMFYRTSKVDLISTVIAATGSSSSTNQPRHTMRYRIRLKEYTSAAAELALYSVHMKAGSGTSDQSRRLVEANNIIADLANLPSAAGKVVLGDLNIQSSNQEAYQRLTRSQNNFGPFIDPIASPGSWDNSNSFRYIHTQDPVGQMDSRYDQILISPNMVDGLGMDYIGVQNAVYSTTTWNDPNHSYRCWGNDGGSYNLALRTTGNTMVGPTIAQALRDTVTNSGHLPVYLDIKAPAKIRLSALDLNFGKMSVGESKTLLLDVFDAGNRKLWGSSGVQALTHSVSAPNGIAVTGGGRIPYVRGIPTRYAVTYTADSAGSKSGTVTVTSNDPDNPVIELPFSAIVSP